jgi:hypothetical protein
MARQRRACASNARGLPLDLVDCLLGYRRTLEEIDQLQAAGVPYDGFLEFDFANWPAAQVAALWARHRRFLTAEARRRGIALPAEMQR